MILITTLSRVKIDIFWNFYFPKFHFFGGDSVHSRPRETSNLQISSSFLLDFGHCLARLVPYFKWIKAVMDTFCDVS